MRLYISEILRNLVATRANFRCEYYLIPDTGSFVKFQIDHIKSVKHGGLTLAENLAYCCPDCNRYKGTDLGTMLSGSPEITPFFNPRKDIWTEHFEFENGGIYPKTKVGEATIVIFQINLLERILERQELHKQGRYQL